MKRDSEKDRHMDMASGSVSEMKKDREIKRKRDMNRVRNTEM